MGHQRVLGLSSMQSWLITYSPSFQVPSNKGVKIYQLRKRLLLLLIITISNSGIIVIIIILVCMYVSVHCRNVQCGV